MDNTKLIELFSTGDEICLKVKGKSMEPFLRADKDYVIIRKCDVEPRRGDVVFFEDDFGKLIMHRIVEKNENEYFFCGDGCTNCEGPLPLSAIKGIMTGYIRNGKKYSVNSKKSRVLSTAFLNAGKFKPYLIKLLNIFS